MEHLRLKTRFKSPFLREVVILPSDIKKSEYPFNIKAFADGMHLYLRKPVTIFVGENGTGKSTLLEAIAARCGFNLNGGNRNHLLNSGAEGFPSLAHDLRLSWFPKVSSGFFMRAESFFNFATYIDQLAKDDPSIVAAYGGKSLHEQSHGESFLSLFKHRFGQEGVYILDEPEAALSPSRQLGFLSLVNDLERTGRAQFIIATHSPILLSYPGAYLLTLDDQSIHEIDFHETEHYKVTKSFLECPERYFKHIFSKED